MLAVRDFRMLWLATSGGSFTLNLWFFTTAWVVFDLTESQLWVGIVGSSAMVSGIALSLVGGAVSDRSNRRRLLTFSLLLFAAFAATAALLDSTGRMGALHLLALALLIGAVDAFSNPAYRTVVVELVGPARLVGANAVGQIGEFVGEVVGPLFLGVLIAARGPGAAYYAAAGVAVIASLVMMRVRHQPSRSATDQSEVPAGDGTPVVRGAARDIREGLRHAYRTPAVLPLLLISSASIIGGMVFPLLPVYARDELQIGATGFGILSASIATGMAAGAISMAAIKRMPQNGWTILAAHLLVYGSMAGFAVSRSFALSAALLFTMGLGIAVTSNLITTALQGKVAEHVRGRVMSLFRITESFEPLGSVLGGALAVLVGNSLALLIGGAVGTLTVSLLFARSRALRTLELR